MTDDIVARLRTMRLGDEIMVNDERAIHQAADEIERLREEVNLWMGVAERFAESHPHFEAFQYYFRARTR